MKKFLQTLIVVLSLCLFSGGIVFLSGIVQIPSMDQEEQSPPDEPTEANWGNVYCYPVLRNYANSSYTVAGFSTGGQVDSARNYGEITHWTRGERKVYWAADPYIWGVADTGFHVDGIYKASGTLSSGSTHYIPHWSGQSTTTDSGCTRTSSTISSKPAYYAVLFARNTATINYSKSLVGESGITGSTSSQTVYYGIAPTLKYCGFSRTGYHFSRWFGCYEGVDWEEYTYFNGGETPSWDKISKAGAGGLCTYSSSLTLYAEWDANQYTVSVDPNGGVYNGYSSTTNIGTKYYDSYFSLSAPTRTGYTFAGWTVTNGHNSSTAKWGTTSNPTTSISSSSTKCVNGATGTVYFKNLTPSYNGSVTLTANWTPNTYHIYLNVNASDGITSSGTSSITATYDQHLPTITIPTRTGYTFTGYYEYTNGGQPFYNEKGVSTYVFTKTEVTMLFAGWMPNKYTMTINPNGGSHYTNLITNNSSNWTRTGNNASLSYTASTGNYAFTNTSTSDPFVQLAFTVSLTQNVTYVLHARVTNTSGTVVTSGSIQIFYAIGAAFSEANSRRLSGDATAEFTAPSTGTYYFRLDNDYGYNINITQLWLARKDSLSTSSKNYTITYKSYQQIPLPTRKGYTFQGYYDTNATTGGTQYYTAAGASSMAWNIDSGKTLYARWTANKYTVTLNRNGGSGGSTSVTATYGSAMPTATMPTRDGWSFLGYYTQPNSGGTQYYTAYGSSARNYDKDTTLILYAQWKEKDWTDPLYRANSFAGGNGSLANPYKIATAGQLAYLAYETNYGNTFSGKYFIQTANIDLGAHIWEGIGEQTRSNDPFCGNYNGNFYKILNIRMECENEYCGLFAYTEDATIKNVIIEGGSIEAGEYETGALAGCIVSSIITGCKVTGVEIFGGYAVAGLVGRSGVSEITACEVKNCKLSAQYWVAGLVEVGDDGSILNCSVIGCTITGGEYNADVICVDNASCQIDSSYGYGTINGTTSKIMYGWENGWTEWSRNDYLNGGYPVQGELYHIGGHTDSKEIHNWLVANGFKYM